MRSTPIAHQFGLQGKPARSWRLWFTFSDRYAGLQRQNPFNEGGDFVIKRINGQWAYQLAVVVDDQQSHVTHIVRGADLLSSTSRQIYLQQRLAYSTPNYLHIPFVTDIYGQKLSKQNGAPAILTTQPIADICLAAQHLGFFIHEKTFQTLDALYSELTRQWARRFLLEKSTLTSSSAQ